MNFDRIRWTLFAVAATTAAVLVSVWLHAGAADASSSAFDSPESQFVVAVNQSRAQAGLQPLQVDATLTASAAGWTSHMIAVSSIGHADLHDIQAAMPSEPAKVGENVGRGQTVASLVAAFMQSPSHRNNILDPAFTHIGVGAAIHPSSGQVYATLRFAAVAVAPQPPAQVQTPAVAATPQPVVPVPAPASPVTAPAPNQVAPVTSTAMAAATAEQPPTQSPSPLVIETRDSRIVVGSSETSVGSARDDESASVAVRGSRIGAD